MALSRWRLRRIWAIETSLLSNELTRRAEAIDEEFTEVTDDDRLAWVFQRLADGGPALALLARYEGNLNRAFDRAFRQLNILQAQRQNEPTLQPTSRHESLPRAAPAGTRTAAVLSPLTSPLRRMPDSNLRVDARKIET
jgi:hypothetical protein